MAEYVADVHGPAFIVGIGCIAIPASEITPGKPDKNTGASGIEGFTLNTVKYFVDDQCHGASMGSVFEEVTVVFSFC